MGKRASKNDDSRGGSPREQLWSTTFVLVVASTLCCFMVGQGLNSSTSVYVALYGGTAAYAGVLAAVFSGAAAVVRLLSGPLIDGRGRRIVMLVGFLVLIVGTMGPLFTHDVVPFVTFRFLQGAGFSAATTASATAAADVLPSSRMGEGIGYYGLGQAIAMSIGPAFALALVSMDPAENLFIGATAAAALGLALIFFCRYEKHPETLPEEAVYRREREEKRTRSEGAKSEGAKSEGARREGFISRIFEKRALPGTLPTLVIAPAFGFVIFFVGLYGTSLGVGNAGLFYTLSAVSMIIVRLKSGAFMDRFAPIKILPVALAFGVVAFAMLIACGTVLDSSPARDAVFYLAGIVYGPCIGIVNPLNQAVAVKNTPPERWGAANALFQLAIDVGIGCASVIWGLVNDSFGFPVTICCVICCAVASYFVARAVYPKED
ncbi:MFS transporter [Ellagibacter sp.]|uniref:MFS transporter n=1 Tax=Ellagibacter sp. TaxID=2137578 RepID=UPI003AB39E6E